MQRVARRELYRMRRAWTHSRSQCVHREAIRRKMRLVLRPQVRQDSVMRECDPQQGESQASRASPPIQNSLPIVLRVTASTSPDLRAAAPASLLSDEGEHVPVHSHLRFHSPRDRRVVPAALPSRIESLRARRLHGRSTGSTRPKLSNLALLAPAHFLHARDFSARDFPLRDSRAPDFPAPPRQLRLRTCPETVQSTGQCEGRGVRALSGMELCSYSGRAKGS